MKKLSITLVLIGLLVSCKTKEIKKVKNPPNIVIIYADDLGWVDVGYNKYSKFYETPYIDKLASEGLILNRFYPSAANCAPSRASMMSGMYSPKHGVYLPQGLSRGVLLKKCVSKFQHMMQTPPLIHFLLALINLILTLCL